MINHLNHLRAAALLIIATASVNAHAANLCKRGEFTVFAFATHAKKLMSVCRGPKESYLVYRFGAPGKIELQFPTRLDASSWTQFAFEGRQRGGGKENSGFFEYAISFSSGSAQYEVYQSQRYDDNTDTIGVKISAGGKRVNLKGLMKSQQGSLSYLDDTVDKLPNAINN